MYCRTFLVPCLAALAIACGPASPVVSPTPQSAISPLAGTWVLTAADEIQPDGARVRSYGERPQGLLIVDAEGNYSLQIFRSGRPRFASADKRHGTSEEYRDAVLGMSTHTGHCFIDPADDALVFEIALAAFPNWEGTVQRRRYHLTGDLLTYQIASSATGNGTIAISEWRRLPRVSEPRSAAAERR